jgi:uncharacterized membrane protein YhaH (DUF805 family)
VNLLFGFHGRLNRAKYWLAAAIWIAYTVIGGLVVWAANPAMGEAEAGLFVILALLVWLLPMLVSSIAVGMRRLHDRNKSGWWLVLFYLGPSVFEGVMPVLGRILEIETDSMMMTEYFAAAGSLLGLGISIWCFVELGCPRGTRGSNRYGQDPLSDIAEVFH